MHSESYLVRKLIAVAVILLWVVAGCKHGEGTTAPSPLTQPFVSPVSTSPLPTPVDSFASLWPAGRVLYHSDLTGVFKIYLVVDGQPPLALTQELGGATEPAWSPDGQMIAFTGYTTDPNNVMIYTMRADGSEKRPVMSTQPQRNWRPDWSPDGTQLLFLSNRDGNFEIYKVNVDGTSLVNLTNHPANDRDADWSPDGDQIVFVSDREGRNALYVMAEDGSGVARLLGGSWNCSFPRWSPDGERIAFTSGKDGTLDIYVMNADGSDVQKVTTRSGDNVMPAWVGNDRLMFSGDDTGDNWDLFVINVDGSGLVQLMTTTDSERYPAWAP